MEREKNTCCFFGHRKIADAEMLWGRVYEVMEDLILHNNVDTFLMGSKSDFDTLCRTVLSELRDIKRIYVRAEYPDIKEDYKIIFWNVAKKHIIPKGQETQVRQFILSAILK